MQCGVGRNPLEMRTYSFRSSKSRLKGRLSVLYLLLQIFPFIYLALETRELGDSPPPSPPRRNYKGGRWPPLSCIWQRSAPVVTGFSFPPGSPCLIPGVCVSSHPQPRQPRCLREHRRPRWEAGPAGRHFYPERVPPPR